MQRRSIFLALSVLLGTASCARIQQRLPWLPRETLLAEQEQLAARAWSPNPTPAPRPRFGWMPQMKRDTSIGIETCGFDESDGGPFFCESATCTNSGTYRGCCISGDCSTSEFISVCYDSTSKECSASGGIGAATMCCTYDTASPYCGTFIWSTSATPNSIFTMMACVESGRAGTSVLAATESVTGSQATTTVTFSAHTSSDSTSATGTDTGTSTSTSTTASSTPQPSSGSSAPVGAIVGGVIGGLAVIGVVVLGVFFMFFRSKKEKPLGMNGEEASMGYQPANQDPPSDFHSEVPPNLPPSAALMGGYYDERPKSTLSEMPTTQQVSEMPVDIAQPAEERRAELA